MADGGTELVQRIHDALSAGDIDGVVALCHPEFRLDMSDRVFNPAVYVGHDGIRDFYAEVMEVWERFTWEPTELVEYDGVVLALLRSRGQARSSGVELDRQSAMIWRVEAGRATSLTFYRDPEQARAVSEDRSG